MVASRIHHVPERLIGVVVATLALVMTALFLAATRGEWWPSALAIGALLLALHYVDDPSAGVRLFARVATAGGVVVILATYGPELVTISLANVANPPQWDFQYMWIYGRVAAEGLDFYQFERAHELARTLFTPTPDFFFELYFWYAPPTMLLFRPLASFDIGTAAAIWYPLLTAALLASAYLLGRLFLGPHRLLGFAVALAILVALNPTRMTFQAAQTNFIALLLVLLTFADRGRARAGAWLALGFVVKPWIAVMGLPFLLRRRWATVGVAVAAVLATFMASVVAFGPQPLLTFLTDNPTASHAPDYIWDQGINQSLLAAVLRWIGQPVGPSPISNPIFIGVAFALLAISCIVIAGRGVVSEEHALALCVPLGLMLYPGTTAHYMVALVLPLGYLWSQRGRIPVGHVWIAGLAGLIGLCFNVSFREGSFLAAALLWVILAGTGLVAVLSERWLLPAPIEGRPPTRTPVPSGQG